VPAYVIFTDASMEALADDLTGDPSTVVTCEQRSHACEFRSVKDSMLKAVGSRTFLLNLNSGAASSCDALEINE
jgi:hypothetical protein